MNPETLVDVDDDGERLLIAVADGPYAATVAAPSDMNWRDLDNLLGRIRNLALDELDELEDLKRELDRGPDAVVADGGRPP